MSSILLAGPWVGEFGWELFCWQGVVRSISRDFDKTIVIGRPGHGTIYKDFCDDFIEFDPVSYHTDGWRCKNMTDHIPLVSSIARDKWIDGTNFDIGARYTQTGIVDIKGLWSKQTFHDYSKDVCISDGYDILIHARNKSSGCNSHERNWSLCKWNKLVSNLQGFKISSIGTSQSSLHVEGTDDMREITMDTLMSNISNSGIVIGPSSGPIHLASLCRTPHLVWSSSYNKCRYESAWNPFNTPVIFYDKQEWNPEVDNILKLINNNSDKIKSRVWT